MNLKEIGEFGFIEQIRSGCIVRPERVVKAIGDDAAAFTVPDGEVTLLTADMLVERVHFLRNATSGFNLGHKALAVNLSDIAAMGGTALEAFVSIAIPSDCEMDFLEDLYAGMKSLARRYRVNIIGGDTTGSKQDLVINITVAGSVPKAEMRSRDGARRGDRIFTTGPLGDSRAGLHLILNDLPADSPEMERLFTAHVLPEPHLDEGRFLAKQEGVHSLIDVSDGLSSDLEHILKESGVGARLAAEQMPVSGELEEFCRRFGFDPVAHVLSGGEDYVLLGTVSPERADEIARGFEEAFARPLFLFGEITGGGRMEIVRPDGKVEPVKPSSWDHFREG